MGRLSDKAETQTPHSRENGRYRQLFSNLWQISASALTTSKNFRLNGKCQDIWISKNSQTKIKKYLSCDSPRPVLSPSRTSGNASRKWKIFYDGCCELAEVFKFMGWLQIRWKHRHHIVSRHSCSA